MNVVKRRWPDLLIGLLVLLLLGGFAALLLGKGNGTTGTQTTAPTTPAATPPSTPAPSQSTPATTPPATTPPAATSTPPASAPTPPAAGTDAGIPTIEAAPVTGNDQDQAGTVATPPADATTPATPQTTTQAPVPAASGAVASRTGGAVAVSEARTPTRNDYRVSLGKFGDNAAQAAATAGVSGLGYVVHPIPVVNGVVAQVGPFASREQATLALADIQRAFPGALLYPPRNAAASVSPSASTPAANTTAPAAATPTDTSPAPQATPAPTAAAPSGPVYLQVGAFNSSAAAQTAVARVRSLGLEPSVNAPAGKLVTVVVGPFQGQALVSAEAKLQAGGLDSFRVR